MAYYSGQVASYEELQGVLVNACIEQGWSWSDQILSKGISFYKLWHHVTDGLSVRAGTGQDGTSLINPSPVTVRLGRYGYRNLQQSFPMFYSLHIFDNEVYLYTRFNVDYFYYAAFGFLNSSIWATACCGAGIPSHAGNGATIGDSGSYADHGRTQICAAFYNTNIGNKNSTISLDGNWLKVGASAATVPFLSRQPNIWNNESILIPIKIFESVNSSKVRYIAELFNSKYLRVTNYEPEQVVSLGSDKWKIYPFYRKNISSGNSVDQASDSGTFGWAIRYDGP